METKVQKGLDKNDSQPIKYRCLSSQEIRAFLKQPLSSVIKQACSKEHLPFLLIVALGTFLRFYQFVSLPMGFQAEEVQATYESYALLLHGADR